MWFGFSHPVADYSDPEKLAPEHPPSKAEISAARVGYFPKSLIQKFFADRGGSRTRGEKPREPGKLGQTEVCPRTAAMNPPRDINRGLPCQCIGIFSRVLEILHKLAAPRRFLGPLRAPFATQGTLPHRPAALGGACMTELATPALVGAGLVSRNEGKALAGAQGYRSTRHRQGMQDRLKESSDELYPSSWDRPHRSLVYSYRFA